MDVVVVVVVGAVTTIVVVDEYCDGCCCCYSVVSIHCFDDDAILSCIVCMYSMYR